MQIRNWLVMASVLLVPVHAPILAQTAVTVKQEKRSLVAEEFVALANKLAEEGRQGRSARQRLAEQVEQEFLSAGSDGRAVSPSQWYSLATALGGDMSARAKVRWTYALRMAFLGEELTGEGVLSLRSALDTLGNEDSGGFVSDWMEAHDSWRSWEPGGLAGLAEALAGESERARLGRLGLAELVTAKYLGDPKATLSVSAEQWHTFGQAFGRDLPTEWRTEWVMALHDAYVMEKSTPEQIALISLAAKTLGDRNYSGIAGDWMSQIGSLDLLTTADLIVVIERLKWELGQIERIATEIERRHFVDDEAVRSVSCKGWWYLTMKFKRMFSDQTKSAWAKKLSFAFQGQDLTVDEVVNLDNVMNELRLEGWQWLQPGGYVDDWLASTNHWRSWPVGDLASFGERLRIDVPSEKAARQAMAEHITVKHFSGDSDVLSVDCRDWLAITKAFSDDLSDEARARWIRKLRVGAAAKDMSGEELAAITDSLKHLGDGDSEGFVADWLANTDGWRSWPAGDYLDVSKSVIGSRDSASGVRRAIAEQFASQYVADMETIRSVGLGQWTEIAKSVGKDLPASACISWSSRILAGYEDDRYALCDRDFNSLVQCLRCLGAAEMSLLLTEDRHRYRPESRALLGRKPQDSPIWRDAAWQRLCWRVISARPSQRENIWRQGVQRLCDEMVLPSESILGALDDLIVVLADGKDEPLPLMRVLADLLRISQDYSLGERLREKLDYHEFRECCDALPPRLGRMASRLLQLEEEGKTDEAVSACVELVKESNDMGVGEAAVSVMRRRLLSLQLAQEQTDIELCRRQLAALTSSGNCRSDQQWNLACQVLFREVAEAELANRRALWHRGISGLPDSDGGVCIFGATFAALDRLIDHLKAADPAMVHVVLCDLLLAGADLPAMQRVQQRRLAAFAEVGDSRGSEAAAALQVMIAAATAEGPLNALGSYTEADTAAASDAEAETLRLWQDESEKVDSSRDKGQSEAAFAQVVDTLLASRAQEIVQTGLTGATPRRKAYVHLFAGDVPAALRSIHGALAETKRSATEVCNRFDDVSLILSVADCQIANADGFSRWIAGRMTEPPDGQRRVSSDALVKILVECEAGLTVGDMEEPKRKTANELTYASLPKVERQALAGNHLARRTRKLVRWGVDALQDGQVAWSARFLAGAVNCAASDPDVHEIVDDIAFRVEDIESAELAMVNGAREVHLNIGRRLLLYKASQMYYKQGALAECLECLDLADIATASEEEHRDLGLAILRAVSLMGLGRHAEGLAVLMEARQWPAASQQHAQVVFLTGWAHLAVLDTDRAVQAFEHGIEKYPNASFVCEARRIVNQLRQTGAVEAQVPHEATAPQ